MLPLTDFVSVALQKYSTDIDKTNPDIEEKEEILQDKPQKTLSNIPAFDDSCDMITFLLFYMNQKNFWKKL